MFPKKKNIINIFSLNKRFTLKDPALYLLLLVSNILFLKTTSARLIIVCEMIFLSFRESYLFLGAHRSLSCGMFGYNSTKTI